MDSSWRSGLAPCLIKSSRIAERWLAVILLSDICGELGTKQLEVMHRISKDGGAVCILVIESLLSNVET